MNKIPSAKEISTIHRNCPSYVRGVSFGRLNPNSKENGVIFYVKNEEYVKKLVAEKGGPLAEVNISGINYKTKIVEFDSPIISSCKDLQDTL